MGGILSGTMGVQGHYANGLAALYLACGQDVACVAESAVGVTRFEVIERGDLYASVTLPNIMVGTVGGGTQLPSQRACLEILGLAGPGKARSLAEVCRRPLPGRGAIDHGGDVLRGVQPGASVAGAWQTGAEGAMILAAERADQGFDPGGVADISRWSSVARPPARWRRGFRPRSGRRSRDLRADRRLQRTRDLHVRLLARSAPKGPSRFCDPFGVETVLAHRYRWASCARPPANFSDPSGVKYVDLVAPRSVKIVHGVALRGKLQTGLELPHG